MLAAALMMPATIFAKDKDESKQKGEADILFATTNHDFGYIQESKGPVTCTFEFENVGSAPLVIVRASASCGCTRPEYPQKPIKEGKTGKIKVTYNPIGRPGPFRKKITVRTNGKNQKTILYIEGSVISATDTKK